MLQAASSVGFIESSHLAPEAIALSLSSEAEALNRNGDEGAVGEPQSEHGVLWRGWRLGQAIGVRPRDSNLNLRGSGALPTARSWRVGAGNAFGRPMDSVGFCFEVCGGRGRCRSWRVGGGLAVVGAGSLLGGIEYMSLRIRNCWQQGPTHLKRLQWLLVVALTVLVVVGANCSGGESGAHGPARVRQEVDAHLETARVHASTGSCDRASSEWACEATTTHGTTVEINGTTKAGKTYDETMGGLFGGATLDDRLTDDYARRLGKPVAAKCHAVIEANEGDTTRCTITPENGKPRVLTIKILDDSTGD